MVRVIQRNKIDDLWSPLRNKRCTSPKYLAYLSHCTSWRLKILCLVELAYMKWLPNWHIWTDFIRRGVCRCTKTSPRARTWNKLLMINDDRFHNEVSWGNRTLQRRFAQVCVTPRWTCLNYRWIYWIHGHDLSLHICRRSFEISCVGKEQTKEPQQFGCHDGQRHHGKLSLRQWVCKIGTMESLSSKRVFKQVQTLSRTRLTRKCPYNHRSGLTSTSSYNRYIQQIP